jgi:hypothetical protein
MLADRDATTAEDEMRGGAPASRGLGRVVALAVIGAAAVLAFGLAILASTHGVHLSNDSFSYLGAATSLADGRGWTYPFGTIGAPVTLFPPVYPIVLAVPHLLGVDVLGWARWQNAVLLAAFVVAVGAAVRWATDGDIVAVAAAALLVLFGAPTLLVYSFAWSETIYLPLQVLSLVFLARHLSDGRTRDLVLASVAASIVLVTRYAGLSLVLAEGVLLVTWPGRRVATRAVGIAIFGATVAAPTAAWAVRDLLRSSTLTGNNHLIHGMSREQVTEGLTTMRGWFAHGGVGAGWAAAVVVAAVAATVLTIVARGRARHHRPPFPALAVVCLVFVPVHWLFLVVANAVSTRAPPFNDRILGLIYPPLVIAVVLLVHRVATASNWRPATIAWCSALLLLTAAVLAGSPAEVTGRLSTDASSADAYRAASAELRPYAGADAEVLSDQSNVAWFVLGRPVAGLPKSCLGGVKQSDPRYADELRNVAVGLGARSAVVLLFGHARHCPPASPRFVATTLGATIDARRIALGQRIDVLRRTGGP